MDHPPFPWRCSRRRFVALACALLVPLRAAGAAQTRPLPAAFDPSRDAARDLDAALSIARATRRRLLVEVGGEWSTWCRILDRFFAAQPELKRIRDANFVLLKVNFSRENQNAAFLVRWPKVADYPHFFVLDADGRLLHSQDSAALESGMDYNPAAMREFLLSWSLR
jgi:hypothetical protein